MVHMKRTLGRARRKLGPAVVARYGPAWARLPQLLDDLPDTGEDELFTWREQAADPTTDTPDAWRRRVLHCLERWRQLRWTVRRPDVPATTNRLAGRFGRWQPRYRQTRGFHTTTGALNFRALRGAILA